MRSGTMPSAVHGMSLLGVGDSDGPFLPHARLANLSPTWGMRDGGGPVNRGQLQLKHLEILLHRQILSRQ